GDVLKNLTMPVLRDEGLMREIQAERSQPSSRQTNTRTTAQQNQLSNPLLNEPAPGPGTAEADRSGAAGQSPVNQPAISVHNESPELEPPSYNPLLD
ncbi:MAG: hypothetical protein LBH42_00960, partial [Treponema sp.]|nr:hypothetical protein [Treponema sp.]